MKQTPTDIDDYAATVGARMKFVPTLSGKQPGDPVRAAEAIMRIVESEAAPHHFVMGAAGLATATKALTATLAEIEAWREMSLTTDFPKGE